MGNKQQRGNAELKVEAGNKIAAVVVRRWTWLIAKW
jgi:hypothetical protein